MWLKDQQFPKYKVWQTQHQWQKKSIETRHYPDHFLLNMNYCCRFINGLCSCNGGIPSQRVPLTFPHESKLRLRVYYETQKQHVPKRTSVLHIPLSLMAFHYAGDGN